MRGLLIGSFAFVACVACSSVSEITPIGKDTYTVGSESRGGFTDWADVKAEAIHQADAYCTSLGKHISDVQTKTHGARGWTPMEADVTFRCLDANDPAYSRSEATK